MKTIRIFAAAFVLAAVAAGASAALSDTNTQFGKGPAQYLMSREELAAWKNLKDDAEAQAFIDTFWARRDPTPTTVANEFRSEFEQRVKYADEHFAEGRTRGSMTDRGRVFIVLGPPAMVRRTTDSASSLGAPPQPGQTPDTKNMIWVYDQAKTKVALPVKTVNIMFVDQYGNDVYRLDRSPGVDVNALLQRTASAAVTNPTGTTAPTAQATMPQPAPAAAAAPPATTAPATSMTLKSAAFQSAVADEAAGKSTLKKGATVAYTELLSPAGDYYVPVGIFVPKSTGLAADAVDTFFGVVKDAAGNTVAVFEEPAKATSSNGDLLADRTVTLPSGKYTAVFGLAKGDQPVIIASSPLALSTVTKDAGGTSKLILTNNIIETATPAPPKSPYAFGKLKIIPKADYAFGAKDDLGYFVEIHNPSIDTGTNLPKMQMKMEITGAPTGGKAILPITAPMSEASPLPLTGAVGPGQYAIIGSIPLSELKTPLKPGDYLFKMKLVDTISKQTYNLEQPFRIVG